MIIIKQKKAFEMSFNTMFAIIAGIIIIFLAIYGVTKLMSSGKQTRYTETGAQVVALLDPFQAGLNSGSYSKLNFKKQSQIYFDCSVYPLPFGKQTLAFSQEDIGIPEKGNAISFRDKYVFAASKVEGKELHVFSKSFDLGFKVADLLFISSEKYCFKMTPNRIKDELVKLNIENIKFDNCDETMKEVCFSGSISCDINIYGSCNSENCIDDYETGFVLKGNDKLYYAGNLVYGAIFSDSKIYECNVKRLMKRASELSYVYIDKINVVEAKGCGSAMSADFIAIANAANAIATSSVYQLDDLYEMAKESNKKNELAICKIY